MRFIFCLLFYSLVSGLLAQNEDLKYDYLWATGYSSNLTDFNFGGTILDFNVDTVDVYYEYREIDMDIANTTICNETGSEILFYSNNLQVMSPFQIFPIPGGLNPDHTDYNNDRIRQGILGLPIGKDSLFYLLHVGTSYLPNDSTGQYLYIPQLNYTVLDLSHQSMEESFGLKEWNVALLEDNFTGGKLTATRHANGRDWWILIKKQTLNIFHRILLTPEGIFIDGTQQVGTATFGGAGVGSAVFSPDGTKYVFANDYGLGEPSTLDVYDFDRCTGLLSNFKRLQFENSGSGHGVSISPNNRYLYNARIGNIYQYDLFSDTLSVIQVSEYDGYQSPLPTPPFLGQLAPNGKIYYSTFNSNNVLHVIHNPNEEGLACNVELHGVQLPTYNNGTIPNHPNYRLGRLIGSPCDTIDWTIDTTSVSNINITPIAFQVSPNPTKDKIQFSTNAKTNYIIQNSVGQILQSGQTEIGDNYLSLAHLSNGIYFISLEGRIPKVAKFVILK